MASESENEFENLEDLESLGSLVALSALGSLGALGTLGALNGSIDNVAAEFEDVRSGGPTRGDTLLRRAERKRRRRRRGKGGKGDARQLIQAAVPMRTTVRATNAGYPGNGDVARLSDRPGPSKRARSVTTVSDYPELRVTVHFKDKQPNCNQSIPHRVDEQPNFKRAVPYTVGSHRYENPAQLSPSPPAHPRSYSGTTASSHTKTIRKWTAGSKGREPLYRQREEQLLDPFSRYSRQSMRDLHDHYHKVTPPASPRPRPHQDVVRQPITGRTQYRHSFSTSSRSRPYQDVVREPITQRTSYHHSPRPFTVPRDRTFPYPHEDLIRVKPEITTALETSPPPGLFSPLQDGRFESSISGPSNGDFVQVKKETLDFTSDSETESREPSPSAQNEVRVVAMDCEMVGCQPNPLLLAARTGKRKRAKEISVAGRCTIVDYYGEVLYDSYIRPNQPILSLRTPFSGITPKHMRTATPIDKARLEILEILRGKIVVAHHITHDLDALSIKLPSESIRDTAFCIPLRKMANLSPHDIPSLKTLSRLVLGEEIQQGPHCSHEDAWTTMSLYRCVEGEWEREVQGQKLGH